jgi:hypothetical protein
MSKIMLLILKYVLQGEEMDSKQEPKSETMAAQVVVTDVQLIAQL